MEFSVRSVPSPWRRGSRAHKTCNRKIPRTRTNRPSPSPPHSPAIMTQLPSAPHRTSFKCPPVPTAPQDGGSWFKERLLHRFERRLPAPGPPSNGCSGSFSDGPIPGPLRSAPLQTPATLCRARLVNPPTRSSAELPDLDYGTFEGPTWPDHRRLVRRRASASAAEISGFPDRARCRSDPLRRLVRRQGQPAPLCPGVSKPPPSTARIA